MYIETELELVISDDPSVNEGDLADIVWKESLSGLKHVVNNAFKITGTQTGYHIRVGDFIASPKILLLRTDKDIVVHPGASGNTGIPVSVVSDRFGYMALSVPSMSDLYVDTTEDTEVVVAGIGDT